MASNSVPSKKTFRFRDDVAYTEDDILIKKLFLFNVAPELVPKQLEAYFVKFGSVKRMQLFGPPSLAGAKYIGDKIKTKTGYIYFNDPRSAARALRRTVHYVGRRRLCVRPSDSWHQPDAFGPPTQLVVPASDEPVAPIMILNDHCLEYIVRLLVLSDRIHFARTCVRFENVFQQVSPALDKCVKFDDLMEMTLWDVRDFFKLSGRHIKQILGVIPQRHSKRIFEFMGAHCINLQKMSITATKLTAHNMYKTFEKMNQLQDLRLRACELTNDSLLALKDLPELKNLDLSNNEKLTGLHMTRLPVSLESLTLTSCTGLNSKLLPKVCQALKHLKALHLKGVYITEVRYKQLVTAKCCNALETITISDSDSEYSMVRSNQYEHIAKLPSVQNIIVYCNDTNMVRPQLFAWLEEFKSKQLQRLEVHGLDCINADMILNISRLSALQTLILANNDAVDDRGMEMLGALHELEEINLKNCSKLSDNAVLRLILDCHKLKMLHLDYCPMLTGKLLTDIIFKVRFQVRQKDVKRPLPIKMSVYGCRMDESSLQNADVAAKDIIDLSFALPSSSELCFFDLSELLADDDAVYFSNCQLDRDNWDDFDLMNNQYDDDWDYDDEYDYDDDDDDDHYYHDSKYDSELPAIFFGDECLWD
ncbi:GH22715 [Drosophila grimshawi]|uniref:GH22715 n=2 Tax=Drosophila grimshawi TaxID=7222 RepID=B4JWM3_DROGR|nr:GH22715 [Drosophila grimshawi]